MKNLRITKNFRPSLEISLSLPEWHLKLNWHVFFFLPNYNSELQSKWQLYNKESLMLMLSNLIKIVSSATPSNWMWQKWSTNNSCFCLSSIRRAQQQPVPCIGTFRQEVVKIEISLNWKSFIDWKIDWNIMN